MKNSYYVKYMNRIKTDAKKSNITLEYIGSVIGKHKSSISKYFNGKDRIHFVDLLKILKIVYEGYDLKDRIKEFALVDTKPISIRECLEWCANTGNVDIMNFVLYFHENSGLVDKALIDIYRLLNKRNSDQITFQEFRMSLEELKINESIDADTQWLLKIATVYTYYDYNSFDLVLEVTQHLKDQLNLESKDYLDISNRIRINEMSINAMMRINQIKDAENIVHETLGLITFEDFPLNFISMHSLMAEMKVVSNYKESIYYINKAINVIKDLSLETFYQKRVRELQSTHDFIKLKNNIFEDLYLTDESEIAHFYAKQNQDHFKQKAIEILNKIEKERGRLSPFQMYYKSLALGDDKLLLRAALKFLNDGNLFYASVIHNKLEEIIDINTNYYCS